MADLRLTSDFLSWLIEEARAFELDDIAPKSDDDSGSDQTSHVGDASNLIAGAIDGLSPREQAELVALVWTGRALEEGQEPEPFEDLVQLAEAEHVNATSSYLLGMPLLPDYLSEAAARMDISITE